MSRLSWKRLGGWGWPLRHRWRYFPGVLSAVLALLVAGLLMVHGLRWHPVAAAPAPLPAPVSGADQRPTPAPQEVTVGMLVTQLYNFQPAGSSFNAELWLWSSVPADDSDVLRTSSFANAFSSSRSPEKVKRVQTPSGERIVYSQKIRATFRHDWSLIHFPFDHQHLRIVLQEDERESFELRLVPDTVHSIVDPEIPADWRLVSWSFRPEERLFRSDLGRHLLGAHATSHLSRLVMTMEIARTSLGPLWRLTAAPLAAVLIVLLSYRIDLSVAGALPVRGGLLGASLFAEIVSLRAVSGPIDNGAPLTLIEGLHLLAIGYTLVATVMLALFTMMLSRSVSVQVISRWDGRAALISSLLLVPPVILFFVQANHTH